MSRHRNVRSMNYTDEYDGYDDVYGHSVEDDSCISPSDAAFMYDRSNRQTQISAFITEEDDIEEVDEDIEPEVERRHSDSFRYPQLSEVDEARLRSCLDEIHSVIGDSIPENIVVETVLENKFDLAQALDALLKSSSQNKQEAPKPQRERTRRSRPIEKGKKTITSNGIFLLSSESSSKINRNL